jgi:hypothetical protein
MESPLQHDSDISIPWGDLKRKELESIENMEDLKVFARRLIRFTEKQAAGFGVEIRTVKSPSRRC